MSGNSRRGAPPDRRALRTRAALGQALMTLGTERGVDAVTVGELTRRAGVGRSTFYAHYADKGDFLAASFVGMISMMERRAAAEPGRDDVLPTRQILAHVGEAGGFAAAVLRSRELPRMLAAGEARLRQIAEANLAERAPGLAPDRRRDLAVFLAGGFMGLLRWWMETGLRREPAQMQAAWRALAEPLLATL